MERKKEGSGRKRWERRSQRPILTDTFVNIFRLSGMTGNNKNYTVNMENLKVLLTVTAMTSCRGRTAFNSL